MTYSPNFWESLDYSHILLISYLLVLAVLIGKFVFSLVKLNGFLRAHTSNSLENGIHYIKTNEKTGPFSFFNYIVFNPDLHDSHELKLILKHEEAHVKNYHSIDQLLSNFLVYANWFNPLIQLYRKRISQNLEFLADREATEDLSNPKAYKLSLLNYARVKPVPLPVNNFHKSFIHTRIKKLHQGKSNKKALFKTFFIIPLLTIFFVFFQIETKAETQYVIEENSNDFSQATEKSTATKDTSTTSDLKEPTPDTLSEKKIRNTIIEASDYVPEELTTSQKDKASFPTKSLHVKLKNYIQSHSSFQLNGKETAINELAGQFYYRDQIKFNEDHTQLFVSGQSLAKNIREALRQSEGKIIVHFKQEENLSPIVMEVKKFHTKQFRSNPKAENVQQSVEISNRHAFLITASTTKEDLRALQKTLKNEQKAALHFSDFKQDDEGNLTQLNLKLRPENGKDQYYSIIGSQAVPDIQLILSDDFTGFRTFTKNDKSASVDRNSAIIINGKPDSDTDENLKTILIKNRKNSDSKPENSEITKLVKSIDVIKGGDSSIILVNDNELNSAEKGSNKNSAKIAQADRAFTIHKKITDKELEDIKTFFSSKNIRFSYRISKRNKSGEITKIKIKTNDQTGKKSAVDYQNNKGISTFKTGIKNGEFFID